MSGRYAVAVVGLLAGTLAACSVTHIIIDSYRAPRISQVPIHQDMTEKDQCMHCHSAGVAGAPPMPHRDYKRCIACHT